MWQDVWDLAIVANKGMLETFVLKTIRSLEHSFPGPFVPENFRSRERINPVDLSLRGSFVPWNFRSVPGNLDLSCRGPFVHLSLVHFLRCSTSKMP